MMQKANTFDGRVLSVLGSEVWRARGNFLEVSENSGKSWRRRAYIPAKRPLGLVSRFRWGRRLTRTGIHHFIRTGEDAGVIFAHKNIYQLVAGDNSVRLGPKIIGSRPLVVSMTDNHIFYGEYRGNPDRTSMHVWRGSLDGARWEKAWTFENVRHIHGVFVDPFSGACWVTTGDDDHEAAIWRSDDGFESLQCVLRGSQQTRAVELVFTKEWIYFGTDAPECQNHICRMDRKSLQVDRLSAVSGPVFYGTKIGQWIFFSTACEPSEINSARSVQLVGSKNGVDWFELHRLKKDCLSMKYFQYGQIMFPKGNGDSDDLWFSPFATEFDQRTLRVPIADFDARCTFLSAAND